MDRERNCATNGDSGPRDRPQASAAMPWLSPEHSRGQTPVRGETSARHRRGRSAHFTGLAAEDCVARHYLALGCVLHARRHRTPHGELDLIVGDGATLVFVEVKRRKEGLGPDSPISDRQWQRLENAALHYMIELRSTTGVHPVCRFDAAIVNGRGAVQIIENARCFEEH